LDINLQRLVAQAQQFRGSAHSSLHSQAAAAVGELGMQILRGGAQ